MRKPWPQLDGRRLVRALRRREWKAFPQTGAAQGGTPIDSAEPKTCARKGHHGSGPPVFVGLAERANPQDNPIVSVAESPRTGSQLVAHVAVPFSSYVDSTWNFMALGTG